MIVYNILLVFFNCMYLQRVYSLYYACPPTSLCVPPAFCKSENITFSAEDENFQRKYEHKYVCGVLSECEGNICCNDPVGLPDNYQPNKTHWYYSLETDIDTILNETKRVPVHLYPGLEDRATRENKVRPAQLCPPLSVCVLGVFCPRVSITFLFGISAGLYSCGRNTAGLVCCDITAVGIFSAREKRSKRSFLKGKDDESNFEKDYLNSSSSYFYSDYIPKYEGVSAKEEKIYKEITGKSTNTQDWVCGRTLSITSELLRIYAPIGDREAKEGDFPWHVAILSSTYEYLCSGVIVDEKVVVTIAHCFDKHNSSQEILVRVGDLNLIEENEKNPAFDVRIKHLVIHPDYNKIKLEADIAVIEMEESVRGLSHVRPACLPGSGFSPAINHCKVPGWGQFSKSKETKNEFNYSLRAASFYQIDKMECQNSLRKIAELGTFFKLQKNVLCAKGYSNADTCKGDGGSGLVCRDKDMYVLEGLVSYGFGCGLNLPGVYTDVQKYLDFIKNYKAYLPGGDKSKPNQIHKNSIKISKDIYEKDDHDNKIYREEEFDNYRPSQQSNGKIQAHFTPKEQEYNHIGSEQLYSQSQFESKDPIYVEGTYNKHPVPQVPEYIQSSQIFSQNSYQEEKPRYEHKFEDSSYISYDNKFDKTSKNENLHVPPTYESEKKITDYPNGYGNIPSSYLPPVHDYDIPSSNYLPPHANDFIITDNNYDNIPSYDYLPTPNNDYDNSPVSKYLPPPSIDDYSNIPASDYVNPPANDYDNVPASDYLPPVNDYDNILEVDYPVPPVNYGNEQNYRHDGYLPPPSIDVYSNIPSSYYVNPPANDYGNVPVSDYLPPVKDYGNILAVDYPVPPVNYGNEQKYRHDGYLENDNVFGSTYQEQGNARNEYTNPDRNQPSNSAYEGHDRLNEYGFTEAVYPYEPSRPIYESEYRPQKYIKPDNYESNRYIFDQQEHEPEYAYGPSESVPSIYDRPGYFHNDYEHIEQYNYNPSKAAYDSNIDKFEYDYDYKPNEYPYDNAYFLKNNDGRDSAFLSGDRLPEEHSYPDYYKYYKDSPENYNSFNEYENEYHNDMRNYKRGPSKDQGEKFRRITPKNAKLKSSYNAENVPRESSKVINIYNKIKDIDSASEITVGKVKSPISLLHKV